MEKRLLFSPFFIFCLIFFLFLILFRFCVLYFFYFLFSLWYFFIFCLIFLLFLLFSLMLFWWGGKMLRSNQFWFWAAFLLWIVFVETKFLCNWKLTHYRGFETSLKISFEVWIKICFEVWIKWWGLEIVDSNWLKLIQTVESGNVCWLRQELFTLWCASYGPHIYNSVIVFNPNHSTCNSGQLTQQTKKTSKKISLSLQKMWQYAYFIFWNDSTAHDCTKKDDKTCLTAPTSPGVVSLFLL